jgi:hypothetical protein
VQEWSQTISKSHHVGTGFVYTADTMTHTLHTV